MLTITNYDLKITKLKPWAIYFDYKGEKYLLHCSTENEEDCTTLYKRELLSPSKYTLTTICSRCGDCIPHILYVKNNRTLAHVDLIQLVWDLTWDGFFDGFASENVAKQKEEITKLDKEIEEIQKKKRKLRKPKFNLTRGWLE